METVQKRKRRSLTIAEKVEILQRLEEKNFNKTDLAKQYGVDRATIRKIEIRGQQLLQEASKRNTKTLKQKYVVPGKYPKLEQALFYWFLKMRDKNEIISTTMLRMQAQKFSKAFQIPENFKFSRKWLQNFKKRFGIRKLKITGEKLSSDIKSVEPFKEEFFQCVAEMGLDASQIYNADESALFYKMLPNHTLVHRDELSASGGKVSKHRITFLPCANANGTHKLPILMIGKSKKPRAFKNIQLPLEYDASRNAWMTKSIFKKWFHNIFVPRVRQFSTETGIEPKALLLLDNCTAHHFEDNLVSDDGLIRVAFLPPNVTPLIQPMDQHVIQAIKLKYRDLLHNEVTFGNMDSVQHLKQINLKDVAFWLNEAWMDVSEEILKKSWKNIGMLVGEKLIHEDDVPLKTLFNVAENEIVPDDRYHSIDEEICIDDYTDADIIEMVNAEDKEATDDDFEDEDIDDSLTNYMDIDSCDLDEPSTSRHQKAVNCLTFAINWAEENDFELPDILHLRKIKSVALSKFVQR